MKKLDTLLLLSLTALPAPVLAHHGNERDVLGQWLHQLTDPLHLGITLLVVLVGVAAIRRALRRDAS